MATLRADAPEFFHGDHSLAQNFVIPSYTTICTFDLPGMPLFSTIQQTYNPFFPAPLAYSIPFPLPLSLPSIPPAPTFQLLPYVVEDEVQNVVGTNNKPASKARSRKAVLKGWVEKKKTAKLWKAKEEAAEKEEKTQTAQTVKIEHPKAFVIEQIIPNGEKTTVMIKNIPNKYTKMLLEFLDEHCWEENMKISASNMPMEKLSAYDFVYLPIDFESECNKGYAFVNFTDPVGAWRMHQAKNNHRWGILNSKKICEITYARLQGKEALKSQFEQTIFVCGNDEYLPVYFEPYRGDGPGKSVAQFTVGRCINPVAPISLGC